MARRGYKSEPRMSILHNSRLCADIALESKLTVYRRRADVVIAAHGPERITGNPEVGPRHAGQKPALSMSADSADEV